MDVKSTLQYSPCYSLVVKIVAGEGNKFWKKRYLWA